MFLKNKINKINFLFILFFIISYCDSVSSGVLKIEKKNSILYYLSSLNNFSASFIQSDGENLSEGRVYIGKKRVRAEYISPTKILIILDQHKAMYYNYELEEDEFFDPKNTNAWFFYDIFRNPYFFKDSKIVIKDKQIILEKSGFNNEDTKYLINVYFENSPILLRKIQVFINDEFLQISIFDHNYNEDFEKNFFKLINPKLLN